MRSIVLSCFGLLLSVWANGQITDTIEVGFYKSAYLLFKCDDLTHDIGTENVSVRIYSNKVVLQTIEADFEESNMLIECDNKIYIFIVRYNENASKYVYDYGDSKVVGLEADSVKKEKALGKYLVKKESDVKAQKDSLVQVYEKISERILSEPDRIMNRGVVKYKLGIYLRDIAIYDDKMFFEFEVMNRANIPYIIDFYQYRVKSTKRRIKGEAFQEVQLKPIMEYSRPERFAGKNSYKYVIVMDKFVLTKNKKLVVEHWEDNGKDLNIEGGRKVDFDIMSNDVLNVRTVN